MYEGTCMKMVKTVNERTENTMERTRGRFQWRDSSSSFRLTTSTTAWPTAVCSDHRSVSELVNLNTGQSGELGQNRSKVTSQLENVSSAFRAVGFKVI